MQIPELPTLEVVSFVTSDADMQAENDFSIAPTACCGSTVYACTATACSTSDNNGGNSCTDKCNPPSVANAC